MPAVKGRSHNVFTQKYPLDALASPHESEVVMSEAANAAVAQIVGEGNIASGALRRPAIERGLLIGGKSVPTSSARLTDDVSPWDGQIYARVAAGTPEDIARAAEAAQAAFPAWTKTKTGERIE
jgi:aldehyde dehydrogenase family protein